MELMSTAGRIGAESLAATVAESLEVGSNGGEQLEWSLGSRMELEGRRRGALGLSYPPVIAGGNRANTIHYIANDAVIRPTDMVLMDAGVDYHGYVSDITRSWVPGGQPSDAQTSVHEALEEVHQELLAYARNTRPLLLSSIYFEMLLLIGIQMQRLGIFPKSLSHGELRKKADKVCPHHVSHYLGMDVHDTSSIPRSIAVEPNVVFTIEPGIYFPEDAAWVPAEFRGLGLRVEDDVAVTETGLRVLSQPLPTSLSQLHSLSS